MLTTRPNKLIAAVHDRMPVIVPAARIDDWLTAPPAEAAALIRPAPEDALIATPVSRRVNKVANDDAACLAPAAPDAAGAEPVLAVRVELARCTSKLTSPSAPTWTVTVQGRQQTAQSWTNT